MSAHEQTIVNHWVRVCMYWVRLWATCCKIEDECQEVCHGP